MVLPVLANVLHSPYVADSNKFGAFVKT